jgi:hypothetical protein
MFFYSGNNSTTWGANLPGSPIFAVYDPVEQMTSFVLTVQHWSDGSEAR